MAYLTTSESDLYQLKPLVAGLSKYIKRYGSRTDLCKAARALLDFVRNLRLVDVNQDIVEQAKIIAPIKTWVPWVPSAGVMLGLRIVPALVIMAYFHAVFLACEAYLPKAAEALFLPKRAEIIGREWAELCTLKCQQRQSTCEIEEALDMAVVPLVYAVRYRTQHAVQMKSYGHE